MSRRCEHDQGRDRRIGFHRPGLGDHLRPRRQRGRALGRDSRTRQRARSPSSATRCPSSRPTTCSTARTPEAVLADITIEARSRRRRSPAPAHVQENTPEKRRDEAGDLRPPRSRSRRTTPSSPRRPRRSSRRLFTEELARPASLPGRPPDQPALPHPGRRGGAGAMDLARGGRARRAPSSSRPARRRS